LGWLRDLMLSSKPPIRSFGRLATQLLGDSGWPVEQRLQARSLATILSKLDRDVDLGWLADRVDVQVLLARALGCAVEVVAAHSSGTGPSAGSRQVRWSDLRYARPFDLAEEALPPGIPAEVRDPVRWERVWWVTPHGGGRSLAGRWLEARALARHVRARSAADLRDVLDASTPLFLELDALELETLLRERSRICVAATRRPPTNEAWKVVESPAADELVRPLLRWANDRLPNDSDFDLEMALDWLRAAPLEDGELDSLGTIIGLAGTLDELGMRETRNRHLIDVAAHHVRRRFAETFGDARNDVAWVRKHAIELMVGMARRALTDDERPWTTARTMDGWLALVPEQYRVGIEVEWLRLSLSRVDTTIRAADIERAARQMSPGAFRIVRTFRDAGILVETSDGELGIRPRWLAAAVLGSARRNLLDGSPFEWGEAILRGHSAARVVQTLVERLAGGDSSPLSDVVELEAEDSPGYVAALETAFRAAGAALLSGQDVDAELLHAVWEEQHDLMLVLPGAAPRPRIEHEGSEAALLSRGGWYLAALAISERLEGQTRSGVLSPWGLDAVPEGFPTIVDAVLDASRRAHAAGEAWGLEAQALVDRLRVALGSEIASTPERLPGTLLDEAAQGVLTWDSLRAQSDAELEVLLWLADARGTPTRSELADACWRAWRDAGCPELLGSPLDPRARRAEAIWSKVPPEQLATAAERSGDALAAVLAAFDDERWTALFAAPALSRLPRLARAVSRVVSSEQAERWARGLVHDDTLAELWQRHAAALTRVLSDWVAGGEAPGAMALLRTAPHASAVQALELLSKDAEAVPRLSNEERRSLVVALHSVVAERRPAWRAAYDLMSRLLA
jgi:hypothetical protein